MKKAILFSIIAVIMGCTPYQRLFLPTGNLQSFLRDSCDIQTVKNLKQLLDTADYRLHEDREAHPEEAMEDAMANAVADAMEDAMEDPFCKYLNGELIRPVYPDSSVWLLLIKPAQVGNDEIILGSLYTFPLNQDSVFRFIRRVKEYSQPREFESGKYVVFNYTIENDSTTIVRAGTRKME